MKMQQKSKSKKHTQSIGGFLSPLWFPIPVPNPVWERFSFCFCFAFHLHFFRFFSKNGKKRKKKNKTKAKKTNPINFAFFRFFAFPLAFWQFLANLTSLLEPSQAQPRAFLV